MYSTSKGFEFPVLARLDILFEADSDISSSADGSRVDLLDQSGTSIAHVYIVPDTGSKDSAYAAIYFTSADSFGTSESSDYTLVIDSSALLDEDAGVDDPLDITISYVQSGLGTTYTVSSNTLSY
jgi:hypothetical protein